MDIIESTTHSFIIKIWVEVSLDDGSRAGWHGHITHVPGGQRRYVKDLNEITVFIKPFLEEPGVKVSMLVRLKRWLGKLKFLATAP